jgi:outer membrane protein assembly factor BamB
MHSTKNRITARSHRNGGARHRPVAGALLTLLAVAACQGAPTTGSPPPTGAAAVAGPSAPAPTTTPTNGPAAFTDVPMYRMDPTHQGVQPGPGPLGQPQLAWSAKAGGAIQTSPVLGDGTLFIGSDDGYLYALDARTGADRWRLDLSSPAAGVPVFGGGVVAIADVNGVFHGVDAATGAERWHTAPVVSGAAPVLDRGIAYVLGTDGRAHGFELATGTERWTWASPTDVGRALAIEDQAAYVASPDGVLHAVGLDGSREIWSYQTIGAALGFPIISGDVVLVNSLQNGNEPTGELYALERTSGKLLWRFRGPSGLQVSPGSVRDGVLYAPTQADGIYALKVADGTRVWHANGPTVFFPAALVDDILYLTSDTPTQIAAVRASDGSPLWALPTAGTPKGNPVVSGGMLFATDESGEIRAYSGTTAVAGDPTLTPRPLVSPSAAPTVPNPFTIVGRHDTAKLGLDRPIALAIGPNGDAYVTETNDRVSRISANGNVVGRWGTSGSKAGEFDFVSANPEDDPHASIAVGRDGKVYVADSDNHRVQVFAADGSFIRQFGSFGTGAGQFLLPFDLNADAAGNVYVLDDGRMNLSKFGSNGALLWTVDGSTNAELQGHGHSADIDSKGRIVVGNDDNGRVVFLDPNGTVVDSFSAGACEVTIDSADNLYISGCTSDSLAVYSASHKLIGSWPGPGMTLAASPQFGPDGLILALDQDGAIVRLKVTLPPS